jgi:hypothetical protein
LLDTLFRYNLQTAAAATSFSSDRVLLAISLSLYLSFVISSLPYWMLNNVHPTRFVARTQQQQQQQQQQRK